MRTTLPFSSPPVAASAAAVGAALLVLGRSVTPIAAHRPRGVVAAPTTLTAPPAPFGASTALDLPRGGGGGRRRAKGQPVKAADAKSAKEGGKKQKKKGGKGKKVDAEAAATSAPAAGGGEASMTNLILNLVKAVVGVGVLSLPQGITSFGDSPGAVLPAALLVAIMGLASGYGFALIGRCCAYSGASSYREAWDRTVGPETGWMVAAACAAKGFFAVLAYSMGLADTFRGIFLSFGYDVTRANSLLAVTTLCLLPLCLLKNLAALAPFSLAGIVAMLFAGVVMALRYFGGDYAMPDGKLLEGVAEELLPKFGDSGVMSVFQPGTFVFVCMLSTAFMAHFNAPKFYLELKNNTVKRFSTVVATSFAASVLIQAAIMAVGFLTFGSACSGLVLNNYSPKDALVGMARIAVAFSVVFTYPMPFAGCRDGVLDLLNVPKGRRTDAYLNMVTVALLGLVTAAALKLTDISFVLSFGGATLGNALIYVFPGLMFRGAVRKMGEGADEGLRREVYLGSAHAMLGAVLGTLGAIYAVKGAGGGGGH